MQHCICVFHSTVRKVCMSSSSCSSASKVCIGFHQAIAYCGGAVGAKTNTSGINESKANVMIYKRELAKPPSFFWISLIHNLADKVWKLGLLTIWCQRANTFANPPLQTAFFTFQYQLILQIVVVATWCKVNCRASAINPGSFTTMVDTFWDINS